MLPIKLSIPEILYMHNCFITSVISLLRAVIFFCLLTGQKVQSNGEVLQDLHYKYDYVGNITEIEQTAKKPT